MAALLEALNEFAKSAAQEPAGTGAAEALAQLVEEAAGTALPCPSGPILSEAAKHFGDLVPVLIPSDREQAQEGRHGREATAHCVAPFADHGKHGPEREVPARTPRSCVRRYRGKFSPRPGGSPLRGGPDSPFANLQCV